MQKHPQKILSKKPAAPVIQKGSGVPDKLRIWLGVCIAGFAFALYFQSIFFDYTYDDELVVQANTVVNRGLEGIPTLLTTDFWYGYQDIYRTPNYRPAALVMFAVEWQIMPGNPHLSHLVNILLFAISCWLLFILLCKLLSPRDAPGEMEVVSLIFPAVCTLLYASHPIHAEVVNSIKSRDEILCFLMAMLSVLAILKYSDSNKIIYLVAGGITYFMALLSKETGLAFLILTPLILYFFRRKGFKAISHVTVVFLLFTGLYLFLRWLAIRDLPPDQPGAINNTLYVAPDFLSRQATAIYILLRYLWLLIFPHPLSFDYSFAQISIRGFTDFPVILGFMIYSGFIIYAFINLRKRGILSFAILFYLITLAPVANVFMLIACTMAERFLYMPSLGYCMALTFFLVKLTKTGQPGHQIHSLKQLLSENSYVFLALIIITGLYSFKTVTRSKDWKDNETLYSHDVKISANSANTHKLYAQSLLLYTYPGEKDKQRQSAILDSSITELHRAISIYGDAPIYYELSGYAYELKQDYPNAVRFYERANPAGIKDPSRLDHMGALYMLAGNYESAVRYLEAALAYFPDSAKIHNDLAFALNRLSRYDSAIAECKKAIGLSPGYVVPYVNLGINYTQTKDYKAALLYYSKAAELDSTDPQNFYNLALAWHNLGDDKTGQRYFEKAARMKK